MKKFLLLVGVLAMGYQICQASVVSAGCESKIKQAAVDFEKRNTGEPVRFRSFGNVLRQNHYFLVPTFVRSYSSDSDTRIFVSIVPNGSDCEIVGIRY